LWKGTVPKNGYGTAWRNQKPISAHRLSWLAHNGPIPEGLMVLHKCDNKPCVNPFHLFLGTNCDNMQDAVRKGRHVGNGKNCLSSDQVNTIRELYASGKKITKIAVMFNRHWTTISDIVNGRSFT
jgi:hypothetical protein